MDLRGILPVANWQIGRTNTRTHITIHYHGPPVAPIHQDQRGIRDYLTNIAHYHMRPGSLGAPNGGDGIQYHYAITAEGTICRLRDDTAVLWHAGHWTANNQSLAIHLPVGGTQHYSDAQSKSLLLLVEELQGRYGIPRANVLGHMEWSPTTCPGPHLMAWVSDFRSRRPVPPTAHEPPTGWYSVIHPAAVRTSPSRANNIVMTLQRYHPIEIDQWVQGEEHYGSVWWAHWATGLGFIHSSALEEM